MPRAFGPRLFTGILLSLLALGAPASADPVLPIPPAVQILGSDSFLPMVQQVAENYMRERPNARIVVSGGGTYRGYKDLLDGTIDIAMATSAPSEQTRSILGEDVHSLISTTVGVVAIVPIVHPHNSVSNVTMAQLHDIFMGHIDNMKHIGGANEPIKVLIGSPSEGLTESWRMILVGDDALRKPEVEILNVKERLARVHTDPGAISFVASADVDATVKALTVNGETAGESAVRGGRYTLVAPLILATTGRASAAAKDFVRYFVSTRKDLRSPGFIAVDAGQAEAAAKP